MKRLFTLILLLSFCKIANAHAYYFAFAEMDYNEMNGTMEVTIIASAHDVETTFKEQGVISKSLEYAKQNKKEYYAINDDLNKHFSLFYSTNQTNSNPLIDEYSQTEFILDGFEILLNGNVQFYLSSKIKSPLNEIRIKFDFLMNKFPEQQNKLTIRYRDKKLTINYLTTNKIQDIKLD